MQYLSKSEVERWLRTEIDSVDGTLQRLNMYPIPHDAGRKMALAKGLIGYWLDWSGGGLLFIKEYGIWPTSEYMPLFDGYRRALGENRSIDEAPGYLIAEEMLEPAIAFLAMALYFMWDVILVSVADRLTIELTHDEELFAAGYDPQKLSRLQARITQYCA
ncbi:MAG: hypothetical protein KDD73_05740 [Anaerolineales bacterium]|nr:hypothetical protein [Anaerolineales bacterium]MCB9128752.1 hypothetical protein [Ardenticatenales bacterium]